MLHQSIMPETGSRLVLPAMPILSPDEYHVVMLAARDKPNSVCSRGRVRRIIDLIFGVQRANRLADPRLEALRRFCVGRRMRCSEAGRSAVLAECSRCGLTAYHLAAAAAISDIAVQSSAGAGA